MKDCRETPRKSIVSALRPWAGHKNASTGTVTDLFWQVGSSFASRTDLVNTVQSRMFIRSTVTFTLCEGRLLQDVRSLQRSRKQNISGNEATGLDPKDFGPSWLNPQDPVA